MLHVFMLMKGNIVHDNFPLASGIGINCVDEMLVAAKGLPSFLLKELYEICLYCEIQSQFVCKCSQGVVFECLQSSSYLEMCIMVFFPNVSFFSILFSLYSPNHGLYSFKSGRYLVFAKVSFLHQYFFLHLQTYRKCFLCLYHLEYGISFVFLFLSFILSSICEVIKTVFAFFFLLLILLLFPNQIYCFNHP